MGTNYYLDGKPPCYCCNRPFEQQHIGKSSAGWCFTLHVIPEKGIKDLEDWVKLWSEPGACITDEYNKVISPEEMMEIITQREGGDSEVWSDRMYKQNYAEPGPKNLVRHKVDGNHCIGHGSGTWDLITGEFS